MNWNLFWYPIILLFLTGCLKTRAEVNSFRDYQDNQTQVAQMQKSSSFDINSRLGEVEESLRILTGKIEEIEFRQNNLEKKSEKVEKIEENPAIQELNKKLQLILDEMKLQKAEILELKAQIITNEKQKMEISEKDPFSQAEELFESKDYRRAILSFQKYRDQNPKGAKFPEATYKIGLCFEKLSMNDEAKSFYSEVIEKFPKSSEAAKAKVRIKKLK
jgi:TolA-binding protein